VWLGTQLVEPSVSVLECSLRADSDQYQVYNGHSNYINNLVLNSNFSNYGMPIDNAVSIDTSAASSWYLSDSYIPLLTHSESRLEFVCSCYDHKSRLTLRAYLEGFQWDD